MGSAPILFRFTTPGSVPYSYSERADGSVWRSCAISSAARTSPSGSAARSAFVPFTMATAFSFFLPITAPTPFLDATWP